MAIKKPVPPAKPQPKASTSKGVATVDGGGNVPAYIKKGLARGTESVQTKDLIIPRLDLMQDISPQVQDGEIEAGHWRNSVTEEDWGDEMIFVPIVIDTRYILWRPRHEGGGILARADDGIHWSPANGEWKVKPHKKLNKEVVWRTAPTVEQSGLHLWGSTDPDDGDSPPAANKMVVVFGFSPQRPQSPLVVSHQRGSFKVGNKFMSRVKFSGQDAFATQYRLRAERIPNSENQQFWVPKWVASGFVDERTYIACEKLYKNLQSREFQIHKEEELQDQGDVGSGDDGEERNYKDM
jgi:hypothetical protein